MSPSPAPLEPSSDEAGPESPLRIVRVRDPKLAASLEAIDRQSFARPVLDVAAELARSFAILLAATVDEAPAGYLLGWLMADELEIHDVATAPAFRRRGVARALVAAGLDAAREGGARSAHLEVRVSNVPAISLYAGVGFVSVGQRRGYYADGEDAILMRIDWP